MSRLMNRSIFHNFLFLHHSLHIAPLLSLQIVPPLHFRAHDRIRNYWSIKGHLAIPGLFAVLKKINSKFQSDSLTENASWKCLCFNSKKKINELLHLPIENIACDNLRLYEFF